MSTAAPMGTVRTYDWSVPRASVSFAVSAASDRGLVRRVNEDSYVGVPPVFLVADGMGGHAFGDRASQAVARVLETQLAGGELPTIESVLRAVRDADDLVQTIGEDEVAGTTLAGIALVQDAVGDPSWMAFNIGDSRIYRWRDETFAQLSVDHSAVQELVDEGAITALEAATHPDRNIVTRALGVGQEPIPDVWLFPFGARERFLLCSDGLTKELDDATIRAVLEMSDDVSPADRLVAAALASGGNDNVTVVVIDATTVRTSPGQGGEQVPAHLEETLPRI